MTKRLLIGLLIGGFFVVLYLWVRRRRFRNDSSDHYGGTGWITWGDTQASSRHEGHGHHGDSSSHGGFDSGGHDGGGDGGGGGGGGD